MAVSNSTNSSELSGGHFRPSFSMLHLFLTLTLLGTIILATIIGNVFVIAAVVLERNLRNVANYLIASLAVADLVGK